MSAITMTGYNNIDWSTILEAVMAQESQPLTSLETQLSTTKSKITSFSQLATKLSTLESAAADLKDISSFGGRTASSTDSSVVSVSADSDASLGMYDVSISQLARAQVTTLAGAVGSELTDPNAVVATGGDLTFFDTNGTQVGQVTLAAGSYTLSQLCTAINDADAPVGASVVQSNGVYKLVLTGSETGVENAFTVQNNLTGTASSLVQTAAMSAADASFMINNVAMTSASNTVSDAINGVTLKLLKTTGTENETVTVEEDSSQTAETIKDFVKAYNDLRSYIDSQVKASLGGKSDNIGNDALLRTLRQQMSRSLGQTYNVGSSFTNLSQIGIEFTSGGTIEFDETVFDDAMEQDQAGVERLLGGTSSTTGAFDTIQSLINEYSQSGGLVADAKDRLEDQVTSFEKKISDMEDRLAIRRASLQAEYAAADALISQLNQQGNTLSAMK